MKIDYSKIKSHDICDDFGVRESSLHYSDDAGFFLITRVHQRRAARTWETISDEEYCRLLKAGAVRDVTVRTLATYRAVSRDQAIRIYLDGCDDHGGMMTVISNALDRAGIEPLKEI